MALASLFLRRLEAGYKILRPVYLPSDIQNISENANDYITYSYQGICKGPDGAVAAFWIKESPLLNGKLWDEEIYNYKSGRTIETVAVNGKKALFLESPPRELIWETDDLLIKIRSWAPCLFSKDELIKIAESMQPNVHLT